MTKSNTPNHNQDIQDQLNAENMNSEKLAYLSAALYQDAENTGERMLGGLALMGLALLWANDPNEIR